MKKITIFFPGALYFDKSDQGGATPLAISVVLLQLNINLLTMHFQFPGTTERW